MDIGLIVGGIFCLVRAKGETKNGRRSKLGDQYFTWGMIALCIGLAWAVVGFYIGYTNAAQAAVSSW